MGYCHIGQQATAVVFAARQAGIDAILYDGSFQDWSIRDLPVAKWDTRPASVGRSTNTDRCAAL